MDGYTKIFESIVTSTIWQAPNDCRVLWITMLALKGRDNVCTATVPALAKMCDLSIEDTEKYLTQFQEPDRYSRSLEFEGRRIKRVDRGWLILNGQKYRDLLRSSERRDYIREKVREHRERKKAVNISKQSNQCKPIADTDTDKEKEEEKESVNFRLTDKELEKKEARSLLEIWNDKQLTKKDSPDENNF